MTPIKAVSVAVILVNPGAVYNNAVAIMQESESQFAK